MNSLRRWLDENDKTQAELAEAVGVTPGAISHWINGTWQPSTANLLRLRDVTGLTLDELLASEAA